MNTVDVLIIGCGQAGLASAYYVKKAGLSFLMIDSAQEIGESWHNRYDSLRLFTPRRYSSLPGLLINGDQDGYPTKDEVAIYLKEYAKHWSFPIQLKTRVLSLTREKDMFKSLTERGELLARYVIVATGPFQIPFAPPIKDGLSGEIRQLHSAHYRNPSQLQDGPVLIVGAGNSGSQIAAELSGSRKVFLSADKKLRFLPSKILGKSIFWWSALLGINRVAPTTLLGKKLKQKDPIIGRELLDLIKRGQIKIVSRIIKAEGNILKTDKGEKLVVSNIIWATGYRADFSWIKVKGALDGKGIPIHERGLSSVKGLSFVGLPWQSSRGSALLLGVAKDAEYIVAQAEKYLNTVDCE